MTDHFIYRVLKYLIALVWLVNGLVCKVLNYVPRHQEIVGEIVGAANPELWTMTIGVLEIAMGIWIISDIKSRFNAIIQMLLIGLMNILEFMLVPNLLLWGKFNIIFASLLILVIYYHEFILKRKIKT